MMHRIFTLLFLLCGLLSAENRVWIYFRDKGLNLHKNNIESARLHLTQRALERRFQRTSIPYLDYTDVPVYEKYINTLRERNIRIHMRSKWLNAVSVYLGGSDRQSIRNMPFVKDVTDVKTYRFERPAVKPVVNLSKPVIGDYGPSDNQNSMIDIPVVHKLGYTGEGVLIALFDTGFILEHESLQHLKVVASWDFVQRDSIVSNQAGDSPSQHNHGTLVLSVVGGYMPGQLIGPAYEAEYLLAKTEYIASETKIEEDNWVAAAEWADSLGADIISTSLGYSTFDFGEEDYSYTDMDGNTAIITRAADLAVKKGILVFSSAGNEGNSSWHYITAPADGDSVIAVGAVQPGGTIASFSSHGPTSDGQIKPDLMAQGVNVYGALPNTVNQYTLASGTSLSCPLAAGAGALLLSVNPQFQPMQVREILRSTASRAQYPDNNYGYGIIDLRKAIFGLQLDPVAQISAFVVVPGEGKNIIQWISLAQVKVEAWIVRRHKTALDPQEVGRINGKDFSLDSEIYTLTDANLTGGEEYTYTLSALFENGEEMMLDSEDVVSKPAVTTNLLQSFPNPFNNSTRLTFSLDQSTKVSLSVFDLRGRLVKNLLNNERKESQFHQVEWDGTSNSGFSLSSGIYYAVLSTPSKIQTVKLMLIR